MKYANQHGYSDIYPFEVVREVSEKTIEVRAMEATLHPDWKPEILPGGFAGHCTNQHTQVWNFISEPASRVIRIRKHKDGKFYDRGGNRYVLADKPRRFHVYNF